MHQLLILTPTLNLEQEIDIINFIRNRNDPYLRRHVANLICRKYVLKLDTMDIVSQLHN